MGGSCFIVIENGTLRRRHLVVGTGVRVAANVIRLTLPYKTDTAAVQSIELDKVTRRLTRLSCSTFCEHKSILALGHGLEINIGRGHNGVVVFFRTYRYDEHVRFTVAQ